MRWALQHWAARRQVACLRAWAQLASGSAIGQRPERQLKDRRQAENADPGNTNIGRRKVMPAIQSKHSGQVGVLLCWCVGSANNCRKQ